MIDLYTWPTPNGRKISILLEELHTLYNVIPINISKKEQFSKKFSTISPSNKIPAIVDKENNKNIFESGAIMLYLTTKYNKFLPEKDWMGDTRGYASGGLTRTVAPESGPMDQGLRSLYINDKDY